MALIDKMMGKAGMHEMPAGKMMPGADMPDVVEPEVGGSDERGAVEIFDSVAADLQLLAERVPEVAGLARRFEALRPKIEAADGGELEEPEIAEVPDSATRGAY